MLHTSALSQETSVTLKIGDQVGARYHGGDDWYPGTIVSINEGTYDVDYGDGETETGISRENILPIDALAMEEDEDEEDDSSGEQEEELDEETLM